MNARTTHRSWWVGLEGGVGGCSGHMTDLDERQIEAAVGVGGGVVVARLT